jgi:RNA polymerase primary sigma factor
MTGEDPSVEYLVEKSGEERKTIERILSIVKDPISLESPVNEDDNTVGDLIPDEESEKPGASLIAEANREIVQNVLNTLDDRERKIITLRYGIGTKQPLTLEEVGNILGLTKERIRQNETNTLRKLRNPVRQMMLKEYFA